MSKGIHVSVSVDIDRFTDHQLRELWIPIVRDYGFDVSTPAELRRACIRQRARGLECFPHPSCDNRKPSGGCAGHERPDG